MQYRRCGKSGLKLPAMSLGLWHNFGENASVDNMKQILYTAFDAGITHFDLANNYGPGPGSAEQNLGIILRDSLGTHRDELVISTKAGYAMWDGPYGDFGSRKHLIASLDQSLHRLGLEYVDIFYHHRMDFETPLEESMEALAQIVRNGKALYIGLSNYDTERMIQAANILKELHCPFIVNQNRYSIFDRTIEENGIKHASEKLGKGLIAYCPLEQGILTDRYLKGIPIDSRICSDGRFLNKTMLETKRMNQVQKLQELAYERGQSLAEMALAWILRDGAVTSVLMGASKPEQILTNQKALKHTKFTYEELQMIDQLS